MIKDIKNDNNLRENQLGMKWFRFFYNFSIPISFIFNLVNLINGIKSSQYLYSILLAIHLTLGIVIFIIFKRVKLNSVKPYPAILYFLTLAFIVYFVALQTFLDVYSALPLLVYLVLNLIYFSKRRSYFNF